MSAKAKQAEPKSDPLVEAVAYEAAIEAEANEIWKSLAKEVEKPTLDEALFLELRPLLRKPIPKGFIKYVPKLEKGKPYESTGVCSVQVQIERMDAVLHPPNWWSQEDYFQDGKLCKVLVCVGTRAKPLVSRSSYGGVDRGSTIGNVYKGSWTNAAKLAFARIGPGHEVYLGAADLDPDVNQQVAEQKGEKTNGEAAQTTPIGPGIATKLVQRIWKTEAAKAALRLAASHAAGGKDVGDCSTEEAAVEGLAGLTYQQAESLERWIVKKETEAEVDAPSPKESGDE